MSADGSFLSHMDALRKTLLRALGLLIIFFIVLWGFRNDLLNLYLLPLEGVLLQGNLVLLQLTDKFASHLRTTAFFSLILGFPFILLIFWIFFKPALHDGELRTVRRVVFASVLLFYSGILLAYFVVLPLGFHFLVEYSTNGEAFLFQQIMENQLTISLPLQVAFTQKFLLIFGFVFQTPLFVLLITRLGLVSLKVLTKYRRHIILLSMVLSAIFTPPDPLTMLTMALPIWMLFELGLLLSRVFGKQ